MTMSDPATPSDSVLDVALAYAAAGIRVLPIKPGHKRPPMSSWQHAATIEPKTIRNWFNGLYRDHGIGLAMGTQPDGRHLFAVDLDEHNPEASGHDIWSDLQNTHGYAPDTPRAVTGANGGHLLFTAPFPVSNGAAGAIGPGVDIRGEGGQIVVAPSIHPNGNPYGWEDGFAPWEIAIAPAPEWLLELVAPPKVTIDEWNRMGTEGYNSATSTFDSPADALRDDWDWPAELTRRGWRVEKVRGNEVHYTRPGKDPREGASAVLHHGGPFNVFTTDASTAPMWRAGVISKDGTCVSLSPLAFVAAYEHQGDLSAATRALRAQSGPSTVDLGALVAPVATSDDSDETTAPRDIAKDGATFILDDHAELEARWGRGAAVLWARGESLVIAAPPGVGKTTLAGQLLAGLLGIQDDVLGYPVAPCKRVLYLAMDRPSQIRRSLRRRFGEEHREALTTRLVVRPGPMPADLGNKPELLIELAATYNCDCIIIDSLKDAAVKLTDDAIGGNVNRAIQHCNAAEIDVLVLHHQRKGTNGEKPTSLEDVYGSTWITAGAGSVVLLWGEAGSELVELSHLKQPADPVGPLRIEHDHHRGVSTVTHEFDCLAYLRAAGSHGSTVAEAAQAEHGGIQASGNAKWKKTERRLRALVRDGLATTDGVQSRVDGGEFAPVRYYSLTALPTVDTPVDTPYLSTGWTPPQTNRGHTVDTNQETPGHTVDTTVDTTSAAPPWTNPGGFITPGSPWVDPDDPSSQPERMPLV